VRWRLPGLWKGHALRREAFTTVLADTLRQSGDLEGALKTVNQAVELQEQQAAGGHAALLINLGIALTEKGMILGRADAQPSLGRSDEALAAFQKAVDIAEELTKKDSIDYLSRHAEATYALEAGNVLRHSDSRKALAVYDQAMARIREAKTNSSTQHDEAELLAASSYPVRWIGQHGGGAATNRSGVSTAGRGPHIPGRQNRTDVRCLPCSASASGSLLRNWPAAEGN
jgi:tetratricopeptide (TPR) repeat protein